MYVTSKLLPHPVRVSLPRQYFISNPENNLNQTKSAVHKKTRSPPPPPKSNRAVSRTKREREEKRGDESKKKKLKISKPQRPARRGGGSTPKARAVKVSELQ